MATKDFSSKKLEHKTVSVDKLVPNPKNPRIDLKPGMPLYEKLKKSIMEFDYIDPIIWNKQTGYVVSGHQRLQVMKDVAQENGTELKEVDVIVVDMPESKQDAFMIAVNKITGLWDQEKLTALFKELEEEDLEFTGFDEFEIMSLVDDVEPEEYSDEGMGDYIDNSEGQLKAYNVILSCLSEEEQEWVKTLLKEDARLKRGYKVSELMERFGSDGEESEGSEE